MPTSAAEHASRRVAIVVHDVSPATQLLCERLFELIFRFDPGIPLTLLVVPQMHRAHSIEKDPAFRRLIDGLLARGAEIALHGLWHLDEGPRSPSIAVAFARNLMTAGEAEFAALDRAAAHWRIEMGLALLHRCGWNARGFVAPAWQLSAAAADALADFPLEYTSGFGSISCIRNRTHWRVPGLVMSARSAPRRILSVHCARFRLARLVEEPAMRLALHPLDAAHTRTLQMWNRILERALEGHRPVTKSELLRSLPSLRSHVHVTQTG